MALSKKQLAWTARLIAGAGIVTARGRQRALAWGIHDFFWLYPTLRRNCQWHGEVVTRFETDEREVWLTIDDGPDAQDTPEFLDLLAEYQAQATFFVIGKKVEQQRPLIRRIVQAGHTLGNHTYSHPAGWWWGLPRFLVRRQINSGHEAILTATGQPPHWFRSPAGMNSRFVHPEATRVNERVIGWAAEGCDGWPSAPTQVVNRIMRTVRPGAIILLHESGGSRHRVQTLSRLLDALKIAGYRCVLPDESSLR